MNLTDFIGDRAKPLGISTFFHNEKSVLKIIRLDRDGIIKDHKSPVPARLILLRGGAVLEEIDGTAIELSEPLDFVEIQPETPHRVVARADSFLLLVQ
jgi:quercetin dioxygenase-like cupin family protein